MGGAMKTDHQDNNKRKEMHRVARMQFLTAELQQQFIIKFCAVVVLGGLLAGAIIYLMSAATLTTVFEAGRLRIISTADFILPAVLLSSSAVIVFIGLFALLIFAIAYRRVRRSLCQIKEEIEKADAGDLENVHLNFRRKDDEFKLLALTLNKLVQDFKNNISEITKDVVALENDCEAFAKNNNLLLSSMIKKSFGRVKAELQKFHSNP